MLFLLTIPICFEVLWLLNLGVLNLSSSDSPVIENDSPVTENDIKIEENDSESCLRPRSNSDAALKAPLKPPCKIVNILLHSYRT